jgi:hypothetical protein
MDCTRMLSEYEYHLQVVQLVLMSGTSKSAHSLLNRTDHVGVTTMERLDLGHLHPNLEVPRLTCPWEASTLEKSHSNSLLMAIRNFYK